MKLFFYRVFIAFSLLFVSNSYAQTSFGNKIDSDSEKEIKKELEEFLKIRDQMYQELLNDNTIFDENAKKLIEKLMNNQGIQGFESAKLKVSWTQNILSINPVSDKDNFEIVIKDGIVKISGYSNELKKQIEQLIAIPPSIKFKAHEFNLKESTLTITFK